MKEHLIDKFIQVLKITVSKKLDEIVALHEPEIGTPEKSLVLDCLDSGWVSSNGSYVKKFEEKITQVTGAKYAVATVNGTTALHVALLISGVMPNDEVIVPALTFVATANAVKHCGACPSFVDSDMTTLGMSPTSLRAYLKNNTRIVDGQTVNKNTGKRIGAIVPMHTFGHPAQVDKIKIVADEYGIAMVEDAAESLGSFRDKIHTGLFGQVGVVSFNGNKIITAGGGGVLITSDENLWEKALHISSTAKIPHRWEFIHDEVGFNYRLPNLNAALGCAQLDRLDEILQRKRMLAKAYQKAFEKVEGIEFIIEPANSRSNYWLNCIKLSKPNMTLRDDLLNAAHLAGYQCRPVWTLCNKLPMYKSNQKSELHVAQCLEASVICLPSSPALVSA